MTEEPAVRAELAYLDPRTTAGRQFIAPGGRVATEVVEQHPVGIRDGRPVRDSFSLDVQGFALVDHRSAVTDLTDPAELDAGYVPEVCRFVQEQLGADQVLSRGWELRRSVAPPSTVRSRRPPGCTSTTPPTTWPAWWRGPTPGTCPTPPRSAGRSSPAPGG